MKILTILRRSILVSHNAIPSASRINSTNPFRDGTIARDERLANRIREARMELDKFIADGYVINPYNRKTVKRLLITLMSDITTDGRALYLSY